MDASPHRRSCTPARVAPADRAPGHPPRNARGRGGHVGLPAPARVLPLGDQRVEGLRKLRRSFREPAHLGERLVVEYDGGVIGEVVVRLNDAWTQREVSPAAPDRGRAGLVAGSRVLRTRPGDRGRRGCCGCASPTLGCAGSMPAVSPTTSRRGGSWNAWACAGNPIWSRPRCTATANGWTVSAMRCSPRNGGTATATLNRSALT